MDRPKTTKWNGDLTSFVMGLILGMIILMILIMIAYNTRAFIFAYCPKETPVCINADYYNNPGEALAAYPNLTAQDFLWVDGEDVMQQNRQLKNRTCNPGANRVQPVDYPQYCTFRRNGVDILYRQTFFNSNVYNPVNGSGPISVSTSKNCHPVDVQELTDGTIVVKWDVSPIPT